MDLSEIVKKYIEQHDTDFAILINGEWGSGKTYFLKNELLKVIEKVECVSIEKGSKNYKLVYVSLYGVTTVDELQKRLFLELNPKLKTKVAIVGKTIVTKLLDKTGFSLNDKDEKELLNIFGGIPKNRVLVFDDLERLGTETLNEVLGFINSYTEHQNLKVIIVADEKKIKKKLDDYPTIKEKLIRFTYLYNPDLINVFPAFLIRYISEEYQIFLKDRTETICGLFAKGDHKNLRTLRFVLDLFEQVLKVISDNKSIEMGYQNKILDRFLYFFISYTIAVKQGATEEELNSLHDLGYEIDSIEHGFLSNLFNEINAKEVLLNEKLQKFKIDFEKSFIDEVDNKFQFFQFLVDYIQLGALSVNELNAVGISMQKIIRDMEEKPEHIALNKLKNCLTLNDEDFLPLIKEIKGYVKEGIYKLETYSSLFQIMLDCSNYEIGGFKVNNEIVNLFKQGMKKSVEISEYKPGLNPIYLHDTKDKLLDDVVKYSEELNESLLIENESSLAEQMCKFFGEKKFEELSSFILAEGVNSIPIFQIKFVNPKNAFNKFLLLNNPERTKMLEFAQTLYGRVETYRGGLKKEKPFFADLLALVQGKIKESSGKKAISTLIFVQLENILQNIVDRLDSAI